METALNLLIQFAMAIFCIGFLAHCLLVMLGQGNVMPAVGNSVIRGILNFIGFLVILPFRILGVILRSIWHGIVWGITGQRPARRRRAAHPPA